MVAGVGFFTDAYDIFAISIAATMLGYCYGPGMSFEWYATVVLTRAATRRAP